MVKVYAPASSANMSVGFDVLGAAVTPVDGTLLGDNVTVEAAEQFSLQNLGRFASKLPTAPQENIVYQCWESFCREIGKTVPVAMTLEKNMPIGSGLGSSACSVVAALVAMNEFCGKPLNETHMLAQDFVTRSAKILSAFIGDEIPQDVLQQRVRAAFAFPAPVSKVQEDVGCLELFHGPTLAFKDFGGRFMAQMLTHIAGDKPVTILTATSGDTGAAVAHAFYGLPNVKVVILYPRGKISPLQEKLFCTLGGNIETVAIDGDFDACQALVNPA